LNSLAQFQQQAAEGHTHIPVVREVLSDLDTPLSVYLKLADGPNTYLFESVEGGERFGRYSIIGLPARRVYAFHGHTLTVREDGQVVETREVADPFAEVEALRSAHSVPKLEGLPGFTGGLVGWFGFECIGYIEPRLAPPAGRDELGTPDILLLDSNELAVFDNLKGRLYLIVHADPRVEGAFDQAQARLDALTAKLRAPGAGYPAPLTSERRAGRIRFHFRLHPRRLRRCGPAQQGIHPRRRYLPGGAEPATERAVQGAPGGCVPRAACTESVAVHVFPRCRRPAGGRLVAGNPGTSSGR